VNKKRLLFVINNFNIGGPQKSLLSLLYKIDFNLYDVNLTILNGNGSLNKYLPKQVRVITPDPLVTYSTLPPKNFLVNSTKLLFSENYLFPLQAGYAAIKGYIKKNMTKEKQRYWKKVKHRLPTLDGKFDVAFGVSGGHSMMFVADCVVAKKKLGWIRSDYRVLNRDYAEDRSYFEEMDEILSVSKVCKDIFVDIFPEMSTKVQVMYNVLPFNMYENIPANTKLISEDKGITKLLTICRLDPHKGLDLAIGALEFLLENNANVRWYVLGGGSYEKELEDLIKEKGLENHFILLGFQFNTAEFIKRADIVVHPSRFEGKSNVIDEAKYLLKPIVATNYETVNEQLTHEKNGLISEMNSKSLASCIQKMIYDKYIRQQFSENLFNERYDDMESLKIFNKVVGK